MKFAGKIMFGEIKNDNIRPNAAAVTMSVVVCVWNHDAGLVDFRYMLTMKSCLAFWQKCIKWRQSESLSEMSLFGFGGKIWSQLRLQGCRFSVIFHFFRYFWPSPFSYFIFLFLNFLSLFVFIFCEMARTRRFSVIFAKVQWHPWGWNRCYLYTRSVYLPGRGLWQAGWQCIEKGTYRPSILAMCLETVK